MMSEAYEAVGRFDNVMLDNAAGRASGSHVCESDFATVAEALSWLDGPMLVGTGKVYELFPDGSRGEIVARVFKLSDAR